MGVHGLATYLRENHSAIANTLVFSTVYDEVTPLVIDGWSFIYDIINLSDLPWVYGGEYGQFAEVVTRVVHAWLSVGLRLYFVFDGPYPDLKFPTIISRMTRSGIQPSLLFFRTSAASRSAPRFLHESAILPPLMLAACVETLSKIAETARRAQDSPTLVEVHFADEEGDPYAVELAARLGAYVVGKDSDFVVLNAEGYAGYIPLDEMVWTAISAATSRFDQGDDDGFQTVVNSKAKKKAAASQRAGVGRGILPPDEPFDLQLTATSYTPIDLAAHLQIPPSLLPLLGALVGNDFTGSRDPSSVSTANPINLQWLFFERQLTLSQRIVRVAKTLSSILHTVFTPGTKNRPKQQVSSVMELIERAVSILMVRSVEHMTSRERERVVERVVDATLQYAIPKYEGDVPGHEGLWSSGVCALHNADVCPLLRYLSTPPSAGALDSEELVEEKALLETQERVRALYVAAYRSGRLDPHILDTMRTGTFWYRQFLENPDLETVSRTFARPIQLWCYALLDSTLGLPEPPEDQEVTSQTEPEDLNERAGEEDDDEDELIDVVEESDEEDPLAPLRGALQQLDGSQASASESTPPPPSVSSHTRSTRPSRQKVVLEYVRRGTRLAAEEVPVPSLSELTSNDSDADASPIQLAPVEDRLDFMLPEQRLVCLTVRWIVSRLSVRAQASNGNKDREKERWSKHEVRAFLASFSWFAPQSRDASADEQLVPIVDRNVQLVAQVLATMEALARFSQVLFVDGELPNPTLRFSGRLFHAYLTNTKPIPTQDVPDRLWHACTENLEHAFLEPSGKRRKKDKKKEAEGMNGAVTPKQNLSKGQKTNGIAIGGKFGLLASLDASA
ncbi:hypothetical protein NM688_g5140 [Phlebia brevispora]|uniref:Uncharacterized protein n=1 Tax=Phlebia brevispora TaxID=194682 RepID=A0ACC1T0K1_9APHY|nr:hypothetical protein NM688_g5140 [Phlebia brevispora]